MYATEHHEHILRRNRFIRDAVVASVNPVIVTDPDTLRRYAYALRVWAAKAADHPHLQATLAERGYGMRVYASMAAEFTGVASITLPNDPEPKWTPMEGEARPH